MGRTLGLQHGGRREPGADALSGLARAFFYAGARALLVSHWRVDYEAATRQTTGAFEALQKDPSIGRAEALRRAMLAYMNDASNPRNAYPDYWAPFSVVGEGGAQRAWPSGHSGIAAPILRQRVMAHMY